MQFDLLNPVQISSYSNKRYFITFINKYSKWLEIKALTNKNDAFNAFQTYILKEEKLMNIQSKNFRNDNDSEYF